ncbi:MAG: hypothetical protein JW801_05715 [Bacteroidales bacterium]|nr:hypothetical protein [Bacteroidales bacterium]
MMKKILLLITVLCPALTAMAQDKEEEPKFGISFSGFVKNDVFYDTRQTVTAREGHFLLWPSAESLDINGVDINAQPNLNMLAVQSRLSGKITGPDAFGAKTSGLLEGDFFAQANDNINLLRLRHAFVKLNWKSTEFLAGQTWNPLFVTGCFPGTVSFNTGTPLQSFARNPQLRITQSFGKLKIIAAMLAQRDFASRGQAGASSDYLRNAGIPDMHLQLQFATANEESGFSYLAGAGIAYKKIVPRLSSTTASGTFVVDEGVSGLTFIAYQNLSLKPFTVKLQYRYGENIADVLAISGFAVMQVNDALTGQQSYTPFTSHTVWGDIQTNGKKLQVGFFGGMLLNTGTKDPVEIVDMAAGTYGLGQNIVSLLRMSPRVVWNSGKVRLALEMEYTMAVYGSDYDNFYLPATLTPVANLRGLFSTYYFF